MKTDDQNELISQRELSRRLNMSPGYINKLVKQGKIQVHHGKKVLFADAIEAMKALRDPSRDPQRAHAKMLREQKLKGDLDIPSMGLDLDDIDLDDDSAGASELGRKYQRAKIKVESMRGIILKLQAQKEKGELVAVADIKEVNDRIASSLRAKMLGLPTKVAPKLEGLKAAEIKVELEDEINEVLSELNRMDYKKVCV